MAKKTLNIFPKLIGLLVLLLVFFKLFFVEVNDPEFYEFYRTLQTYRNVLDDNTKIIIDSNSPFAKYLFGN